MEKELIELIDLAEKQIKTIKLISGFSDVHLYPQLQIIKRAKDALKESNSSKPINSLGTMGNFITDEILEKLNI